MLPAGRNDDPGTGPLEEFLLDQLGLEPMFVTDCPQICQSGSPIAAEQVEPRANVLTFLLGAALLLVGLAWVAEYHYRGKATAVLGDAQARPTGVADGKAGSDSNAMQALAFASHEIRNPMHGVLASLELAKADFSLLQLLLQRGMQHKGVVAVGRGTPTPTYSGGSPRQAAQNDREKALETTAGVALCELLGEATCLELLDALEGVNLARTSAEGCHRVVNDLVDFTRLTNGTFSSNALQRELIDSRTCLKRVLLEQKHFIPSSVRAAFRLDPAFPPSLFVDQLRLGQVLVNGLTNASKFIEAGSITLTAASLDLSHIPACRPKHSGAGAGSGSGGAAPWLALVLSDTGRGLAGIDTDALFEAEHSPVAQASTPAKPAVSMPLGLLSTVYQGTLRVSTTLRRALGLGGGARGNAAEPQPEGTTVRPALPVHAPALAAPHTSSRSTGMYSASAIAKSRGSGLGLPLARLLARAQGGDVELYSDEDKDGNTVTRFFFLLPHAAVTSDMSSSGTASPVVPISLFGRTGSLRAGEKAILRKSVRDKVNALQHQDLEIISQHRTHDVGFLPAHSSSPLRSVRVHTGEPGSTHRAAHTAEVSTTPRGMWTPSSSKRSTTSPVVRSRRGSDAMHFGPVPLLPSIVAGSSGSGSGVSAHLATLWSVGGQSVKLSSVSEDSEQSSLKGSVVPIIRCAPSSRSSRDSHGLHTGRTAKEAPGAPGSLAMQELRKLRSAGSRHDVKMSTTNNPSYMGEARTSRSSHSDELFSPTASDVAAAAAFVERTKVLGEEARLLHQAALEAVLAGADTHGKGSIDTVCAVHDPAAPALAADGVLPSPLRIHSEPAHNAQRVVATVARLPAPSPAPMPTSGPRCLRVLYVDDESTNVRLGERMIARIGKSSDFQGCTTEVYTRQDGWSALLMLYRCGHVTRQALQATAYKIKEGDPSSSLELPPDCEAGSAPPLSFACLDHSMPVASGTDVAHAVWLSQQHGDGRIASLPLFAATGAFSGLTILDKTLREAGLPSDPPPFARGAHICPALPSPFTSPAWAGALGKPFSTQDMAGIMTIAGLLQQRED